MSFRVEEKVPVTAAQLDALIGELQTMGLTQSFPPRRVRSVYFDNLRAQAFHDSEEGVVPRRKIRIRCYPDQEPLEYQLETKISAVEGRFKYGRVLPAPECEDLLARGLIDPQYGVMMPRVVVEYERAYWKLRDFRITTDRHIHYHHPEQPGEVHPEPFHVLEIKADSGTSTDYLRGIIPTGRARFSKFSNAMRSVLAEPDRV